ncbi:MAG: FtsW/RodA/SpoVE family cell cycle protein [Erysipelotrichaceae bacterium]|nr:FtsW/RodA/SpoVE family cell cycle protein [Erysipelotrichaceae bacterium]
MQKRRKFSLFPAYCDRMLVIATLALTIIGTAMVMSAEMGSRAGETSTITTALIRQGAFIVLGLVAMIFFTRIRATAFRRELVWAAYYAVLVLLLMTRLWPAANGAYGWIRLGFLSFQPSELAKVAIMVLGAKLLGHDSPKNNEENFKRYGIAAAAYFVIILLYQKDLGSAVVLIGIAFVIGLIPPYRELTRAHVAMVLIMAGLFAAAIFLLSPWGTSLLEHFSGHYMVARFLASADPFANPYDSGYHLIMSMVSFATGGWFGLGYGQSIHKYMNFPNPSTDFILPVIVEELGIVWGLLPILVLYGALFYRLIRHSLECNYVGGKMIIAGTMIYLALHFVLNIGGVSGLIPLTGVPLLLISSGGSSVFCTMMAIGIAESEIIRYRKEKTENENSSR